MAGTGPGPGPAGTVNGVDVAAATRLILTGPVLEPVTGEVVTVLLLLIVMVSGSGDGGLFVVGVTG